MSISGSLGTSITSVDAFLPLVDSFFEGDSNQQVVSLRHLQKTLCTRGTNRRNVEVMFQFSTEKSIIPRNSLFLVATVKPGGYRSNIKVKDIDSDCFLLE